MFSILFKHVSKMYLFLKQIYIKLIFFIVFFNDFDMLMSNIKKLFYYIFKRKRIFEKLHASQFRTSIYLHINHGIKSWSVP